MPKHFLFEKSGVITTITFNRPERRNCLDDEVILELEDLAYNVRDDRETRALIVTGTGNAFRRARTYRRPKGSTIRASVPDLPKSARGAFRGSSAAYSKPSPILSASRSRRSTVMPSAVDGRSLWPLTSVLRSRALSFGCPKSIWAFHIVVRPRNYWRRGWVPGVRVKRFSNVATTRPRNCLRWAC